MTPARRGRRRTTPFWLGILDCDFEVDDSPELGMAVARLAARYARTGG